MDRVGESGLNDPAFMMTHLWPGIGEEGPNFRYGARGNACEQCRSIDLGNAKIGYALLSGNQHGVGDTRIVDFDGKEVRVGMVGRRCDDIFPLSATYLDDQRQIISPCLTDELRIEREIIPNVKRTWMVVDIQYILC